MASSLFRSLVAGSSPRVRGKRAGDGAQPHVRGLIPARAGKTPLEYQRFRVGTAHPRACGENVRVPHYAQARGGSSPRVRGKHHVRGAQRAPQGLIPACAGKTTVSTVIPATPTAHPRVCGENHVAGLRRQAAAGSSPRVRGKPAWGRPPRSRPGLIPARAGKTWSPRARSASTTAHPRACGENVDADHVRRVHRGSSPRVRGKRKRRPLGLPRRGLIPARAGKTGHAPPPRRGGRAHPRACGENTNTPYDLHHLRGSSPRVRGKRAEGQGRLSPVGLIPARAGKTRLHKMHVLTIQAHPRACGENFTKRDRPHMSNGSSPRVRGKQPRAVRAVGRCRLIPARAGKTRRVGHPRPPSPAHPRACGENAPPLRGACRVAGSSPRVRGKPSLVRLMIRDSRLIPARAGKTGCSPRARAPCEAHPRACGENCGRGIKRVFPPGSSPRVRGKRCRPWGWAWGFRLIPARAGKTDQDPPGRGETRAHPRACGENWVKDNQETVKLGSSPRVRGKREHAHQGMLGARLIPARAGKTRKRCLSHWCRKAHPRACGENVSQDAGKLIGAGSSPRVRGKQWFEGTGQPTGRLIPARAGKTIRPQKRVRNDQAHPRACGENATVSAAARLASGSSPRVRGKLISYIITTLVARLIPARAGKRELQAPGAQPGGLIPARAGKTRQVSHAGEYWAAHPRACGENMAAAAGKTAAAGSSPRVRGKRDGAHRRHQPDGLIPARAGKTPTRA